MGFQSTRKMLRTILVVSLAVIFASSSPTPSHRSPKLSRTDRSSSTRFTTAPNASPRPVCREVHHRAQVQGRQASSILRYYGPEGTRSQGRVRLLFVQHPDSWQV